MRTKSRAIAAVLAGLSALALGTAAPAQMSDSYKFLKAVRDADGAKVTEMLNEPGATVINTKDYGTGETALHIAVKRRDPSWVAFLLSRGAKVDVRDGQGNTPLTSAAQLGFTEGARILLSQRAPVNLGNNRGETPLILAVQNRDVATVRLLLGAGANPSQTDRIAGMSARDYAARDGRSAAILRILDEAKPGKVSGPIAGPKP